MVIMKIGGYNEAHFKNTTETIYGSMKWTYGEAGIVGQRPAPPPVVNDDASIASTM